MTRRTLFASLGLATATGAGITTRSGFARYYEGPVSDHFDGVRFFDARGAQPKGFGDFLRWQFSNDRNDWPDWVPSPLSDRPPRLVDSARECRVSFIGHASLLIQAGGVNILVDPVWSSRVSPVSFAGPKRVNDPGVTFDLLPKIDAVLVSHCHYDHLDMPTLSSIATRDRPRVVTPLGNDAIMRAADSSIGATAHDWGERVELGNGIAVTLVPMRHWSARGVLDRNKALWAGFVIETPAGRIYHATDTGYGDGFHFRDAGERYGPFRLAILPIGAYEPRWFMKDQHMNPEEAVQAFRDLGAQQALAHHYGTFQLTDEAFDAPLQALAEARDKAGLTAQQFVALQPGGVLEL